MSLSGFDCLIVGRGLLGLAHALAAARQGLRVAVIDREARAVGASVREFGLVDVVGQAPGLPWRRARRTRELWGEVTAQAGIRVEQRGLLAIARRRESLAMLEEFADGPTAPGCRLLRGKALAALAPPLRRRLHGALYSPHELRVDSRAAVPRIAAWLAAAHDVQFLPRAAVHAVAQGRVETSRGPIAAAHVVVCPGPDLTTLFADLHAGAGLALCKRHMLRLAAPGWRLPAPLISDLGLLRLPGFADCPSLPALRGRIAAEQASFLADGIHPLAVQSSDGTLVVGTSHKTEASPDPFQPQDVDDRILDELGAVLDLATPVVIERWISLHVAGGQGAFTAAPLPQVRLVHASDASEASTAFALAEETLADLLGLPPPPHVTGEEVRARHQDGVA